MASAGNSTKTIVVKLSVLPEDAIKGIKYARKELELLEKRQAALEKAGLKNSDIWIKNEAEIRNLNQVIKANQNVLNDAINQQKQNGDSLNALRAQLAALLKQYDDLSKAERESAQGTDMLNHIKSLTEEIKGLEEGTKRFGRSVGSYEEAINTAINGTLPLKTAMKGIKEELTRLEIKYRESAGLIQGQQQVIDQIAQTQGKESQAYKDASAEMDNLIHKREEMKSQIDDMTKKAGDLYDSIQDVNQSIQSAGADYAPLVAAKQSADLLVNSYTALHGTLVALGVEDQNLVEIYSKLQIVQQGLNSLTQIYNLLQKQSVLRQQLSVLWTNLTTKSLGSLIAAKRQDASASVAATAGTSALAAGEGVATATSWTLVGALKAVSAAIMNIPIIGWIVAAVAALGTLTGLIISANKEEDLGNKIADDIIAKDQERINNLKDIARQEKQIAENTKEQAKELSTLDKNSRAYKDNVKDIANYLGVSEEYIKKHPEELQKAIDAQEKLNELAKQMEENEKAINEAIKNREELQNGVNNAVHSGWESSNQQLKKMVDDGKINEDQMKRIQKIRKQLVKGKIDESTANERIYNTLSEQVSAYNQLISKSQTMNNSLKQQLKTQRDIVDEIQTNSDNEENAKAAASAAKERRKAELAEVRKTQDMELKMVKDGLDKQIQQYRITLDREIEDLKDRLKNENNLTKKAKEEINKQITLLTAKQVQDEYEIRKKYDDTYIKEQLNLWKAYYRSVQDAMPKDTEQALEARIGVLTLFYEASVEELKKTMKLLNNTYIEWEAMAQKSGKERTDMLERLGMTEEEFSKAHSNIVNQWYEQNQKFTTTLENMQKAHNNEVVKMRGQFNEEIRNTQQETVDIVLENFNQSALNDLEVSNFRDKEVRKAKIAEDMAARRLQLAKDEATRIANLSQEEITAIYGTDAQYQLALQKAMLNVTKAEGELKKATKDTAQALKDQKQAAVDNAYAIGQAMSDIAGTMASLFNTLAEDNEQYSDFATGMALAQIMISSAIAIAQAIQAAVQAGAFTGAAAPATIPAFIAELVTIVASGIASAVSTLKQAQQAKGSAPKFATGGLITEGHDTTGKKDNVHIMASKGEYVVKKKAVDTVGVEFLDKINNIDRTSISRSGYYAAGGEVTTGIQTSIEAVEYDKMKATFVEALKEIPNPVVSVKEITTKQKRVAVKEKLARS